MNIEKEIDLASKRIENRKEDIEKKLENLRKNILIFTYLAWCLVLIGLAIGVIATVSYFQTPKEEGFGLNLLGDFLGGSVASIWSLADYFLYM